MSVNPVPAAASGPVPTYAAALISLAIAVLTAATQIPSGTDLSLATVLQLAVVSLSAIATYLLPLLKNQTWQGGLKTGAAIAGAIATAIIPLVGQGSVTYQQAIVVILAGLNAVGVEAGVSARVKPVQ
jgi:hypothetical protein